MVSHRSNKADLLAQLGKTEEEWPEVLKDIRELPVYKADTPGSRATERPAPVEHVKNGPWGGIE
jgi:hypothetical protein